MSNGNLFKAVWRGWFASVGILAFMAILLGYFFGPDLGKPLILLLALVPLIAALQGVVVATLVCVGVKVWPSK